jgi:hypothetical protein
MQLAETFVRTLTSLYYINIVMFFTATSTCSCLFTYCYSWCVWPRYVAVIRDNGMVCESLIHGSCIMKNLGVLDVLARALYMWGSKLLEIVEALSAISGLS